MSKPGRGVSNKTDDLPGLLRVKLKMQNILKNIEKFSF